MTSGSNLSATRPGQKHFEIFKRSSKWEWIYYSDNRRPQAASPKGYKRRQDAIKAIQVMIPAMVDAEIMLAEQAGSVAETKAEESDDGDETTDDDE